MVNSCAEFEIDPGIAIAGQEISDGDLLPEYNTTASLEQGNSMGITGAKNFRTISFQDHLYGMDRHEKVTCFRGLHGRGRNIMGRA